MKTFWPLIFIVFNINALGQNLSNSQFLNTHRTFRVQEIFISSIFNNTKGINNNNLVLGQFDAPFDKLNILSFFETGRELKTKNKIHFLDEFNTSNTKGYKAFTRIASFVGGSFFSDYQFSSSYLNHWNFQNLRFYKWY